MYNFSLVKRKKRNKRIAIATIVGSIGVASMCIVAFLGRQVGTFTINLKNEGVELAMVYPSNSEDETTYINATGLDSFVGAYTYEWFFSSKTCGIDQIHNLDTSYTIAQETDGLDGEGVGLRFFKISFLVRNVGVLNASYDLTVNLTSNTQPMNSDAVSVDEYLRVWILEGENDRTGTVFAHYSNEREPDEKGRKYTKEYVSGKEGDYDYHGEAELFNLDGRELAKVTNSLSSTQERMYTLVFWLEGKDPECSNIPKNASLRIGATINARPQDEKNKEAD